MEISDQLLLGIDLYKSVELLKRLNQEFEYWGKVLVGEENFPNLDFYYPCNDSMVQGQITGTIVTEKLARALAEKQLNFISSTRQKLLKLIPQKVEDVKLAVSEIEAAVSSNYVAVKNAEESVDA